MLMDVLPLYSGFGFTGGAGQIRVHEGFLLNWGLRVMLAKLRFMSGVGQIILLIETIVPSFFFFLM